MKTNEEILTALTEVFKDVLDSADVVLTLQTKQDDIDEWDSLAHIQLVLAIGRRFGVSFTTQEVVSWDNVGAIVDSIKGKLK